MLFKFLIDRGVGHIAEPRPSLIKPPANTNWAEKKKAWEKFVAEREWEYFLRKYTDPPGLTKAFVVYGGVARLVSGRVVDL